MPNLSDYMGRFYFLRATPTDTDWEVKAFDQEQGRNDVILRRWQGTPDQEETRRVALDVFETDYQCQQADPLP